MNSVFLIALRAFGSLVVGEREARERCVVCTVVGAVERVVLSALETVELERVEAGQG